MPLPKVVVDIMAAHLAAYLSSADGFVLTNGGQALTRSVFGHLWRCAARPAGCAGVGTHGFRHYYVSLLIGHGESAKVDRARLRRASSAETLDT